MTKPLIDVRRADLRHRFMALADACPIVAGSTVSTPLVNVDEAKVVLFAMDAGQELSDHSAPFLATVEVLEGRLRFGITSGTAGAEPNATTGPRSEERDMGPGDWLLMPPNARHRLTALEPTRFMLVLFRRPAG